DPSTFGLDMILPMYFLALIMGFRDRPRWGLVVGTSAVAAIIVHQAPAWGFPFLGPPWHVTLGALAGILVAALLPPPGRKRRREASQNASSNQSSTGTLASEANLSGSRS
ncbi:MAG: hypothetical protein AAGF49_04255, partial [Pseudomonadota bacterium]